MFATVGAVPTSNAKEMPLVSDHQVTDSRYGKILTNTGVWSPDGRWIVYDVRSDRAGDSFDGTRIEMVNVETREVKCLYESRNGARCGVVTFHPSKQRVVFILGPENPTPDWTYSAYHRQGVLVDTSHPNMASNMDARDIVAPFTPGALRGGTHVQVFSPDGEWVSFTYEDHVLSKFHDSSPDHDLNQRNVGVSVPARAVTVPKSHPRNHDGAMFTVLATRTTANPKPGSDEIKKAYEDAWIGSRGYVRTDGTRQIRALAFQGDVVAETGKTVTEVFVADLPENVTIPGNDGPLEGTETRLPRPPRGTKQRRITFTTGRKYPGIQGPRHWLRSSPDGSQIAFLMRDDAGIVQIWTVSPNGGPPNQLTHNDSSIASAFTWSRDGRFIAHAMDNSVCITNARTGQTRRLTERCSDEDAPRPEACVFSPDGHRIAYMRRVGVRERRFNQIFVVDVPRG